MGNRYLSPLGESGSLAAAIAGFTAFGQSYAFLGRAPFRFRGRPQPPTVSESKECEPWAKNTQQRRFWDSGTC